MEQTVQAPESAVGSVWFASRLRAELALRSRRHAHGKAHVESYGSPPVIVFAPEKDRHGNFFDPDYAAILKNPAWMRRFNKVHTQGARNLPRAERRWRELDSSMSSDALLMNVFCTPGVAESTGIRNLLGVEPDAALEFGWKAHVPLRSGRFDRTEVDLRFGSLLIEAKLTESDFQTCALSVVEAYRDFDAVFERQLLPQVELPVARPRRMSEFPEDYSQESESLLGDPDSVAVIDPVVVSLTAPGYASYQLIRNVLAACASQCSFCVLHDARRPDLKEEWFRVMAAVRHAELRARLKVLTWQELAAHLPGKLQAFLDAKYGIVAPGKTPISVGEFNQDDLSGI
jgi:hypothetical protein